MKRRSSRLKGKRYRLARQRTLATHERRTGRPWSDRFEVGSVTGYPIGPKGTNGAKAPVTVWYVHDTAYCGKVVGEFRTTPWDDGKLLAERLARKLNMADWEADHR